MINRVILVANMTRDAEAVSTSGKPMTKLRIATNSSWRDASGERQERSEFHSLVAFGRLAEICAVHCLKGRRVYVEGHLRTRDFSGADGSRRQATEVVLETLRLLQPRSAGPAVNGALAG